jgi:hypothetical protein
MNAAFYPYVWGLTALVVVGLLVIVLFGRGKL